MKRSIGTALFTFAAVVTAALVTAAGVMAQSRAIHATVPFDFSVGDRLLPAGSYEIWSPSRNMVEIQNRDNHATMLTATTYNSHESRNGGKLVFHKYRDRYFLSEILCASSDINVS